MTTSCLQNQCLLRSLHIIKFGVTFVPSKPQLLWFDPEETFPGRFQLNDAGLFLSTAHSLVPDDVLTELQSHFSGSDLLFITIDSLASSDYIHIFLI